VKAYESLRHSSARKNKDFFSFVGFLNLVLRNAHTLGRLTMACSQTLTSSNIGAGRRDLTERSSGMGAWKTCWA
jgi:hypothetical protein